MRIAPIALVFFALACGPSPAAGTPAAPTRMDELRERLEDTRDALAQAEADAAKANRAFYRYEHDVVYTNAAAKILYDEIERLESQIAERRQKLSKLMSGSQEQKQIQRRRMEAFRKVSDLKDKELSLQNDIRAEKWRQQAQREEAAAAPGP
jgi:chromosome segregation ATPase